MTALSVYPKRIQRSRAKGWRMPENAVYVGRPTPWGNPFVTGVDGTQAECVDLYCKLLRGLVAVTTHAHVVDQKRVRDFTLKNYPQLRGKDLVCWCRKSPCHADVLLKLANMPEGK